MGRDPWLSPYTDHVLESMGKSGVKKLLVICPAFVSDCPETLEEIGLRGREIFRAGGGGELTMIPCLNDYPRWIETLERMANHWLARPGEKLKLGKSEGVQIKNLCPLFPSVKLLRPTRLRWSGGFVPAWRGRL